MVFLGPKYVTESASTQVVHMTQDNTPPLQLVTSFSQAATRYHNLGGLFSSLYGMFCRSGASGAGLFQYHADDLQSASR